MLPSPDDTASAGANLPAAPQRAALVLATASDKETQYVSSAAWDVSRQLRQDHRFQPLDSFAFHAHIARRNSNLTQRGPFGSVHEAQPLPLSPSLPLYDGLLREINRHPDRSFVLGFISSHGVAAGLQQTLQANEPVFLDLAHCALFRNAVIVLAACVPNGTFANAILRIPGSPVHTVFGYEDKLYLPHPAQAIFVGQRAYHEFQVQFLEALVQPITSLLRGASVQQAHRDTEDCWQALDSAAFCQDFRDIAIRNTNALRIYTNTPQATL